MAPSTGPLKTKTSSRPRGKNLCGVVEEAAAAAQEKRRNRTKPQPWAVRKLMIAVTLGIMGYAAYVYIRQLCLPIIWRRPDAPAARGTGIALLVVFCVLYLWMLWSYAMVCLTSPGYARDHIPKAERPLFTEFDVPRDSWLSTVASHTTSSAAQHDPETGNQNSFQQPRRSSLSATTSRTHGLPLGASPHRMNGLAGPSYEDLLRRDGGPPPQSPGEDPNVGTIDSITRPANANAIDEIRTPNSSKDQHTIMSPVPASSPTITSQQLHDPKRSTENEAANGDRSFYSKLKKHKPVVSSSTMTAKQEKALATERRLQALSVTRKPSTTPVLNPAYRYCSMDGIVKPYRAHHCRVCGTCVLKYDHHCPWIGQCVGARNHKFFLNFNQATVFLTAYILGTTIAYTVKSSTSFASDVNPQEIVLIALSALFLLFTTLLAVSHIHLILNGQTTVESMQIRSMKDREEQTLARGFKWWEFGAKRRKQKEWDQEWGRFGKEGYIWWKGSSYEHWVDVMGKNWVGWILPTGRGGSGSDGLDYPVNPRFDSEGRWRRRSEWPEELR